MKAAFFHDHVMRQKDENYFSTGSFPYEVFKRYLSICDDLFVCTRIDRTSIDNEKKLVKSNGENVHIKPIENYRNVPDYLLKNKKIKKEIKEIIEVVDIVIVRLPSMIGSIAFYEAKRQNKVCIVELVGCPWDSLLNHGTGIEGIKGKVLAPYMYFRIKNIIKQAKYIVYVTEKFLQKRYPSKGKSIACSNVNIEHIDNLILEKRMKKIQNMKNNNKIKIGLVGSLNVKYKGHKTAIKSLYYLLKNIDKNLNIELHFLGPGNKKKWEKLIKKYNLENYIFFDSTLPAGEPVLNWIDDNDIMIAPSLSEGLPRAIIEAMSRGCPVIGTYVGGIPELLEDIVLIKKRDYKNLAKKINVLCKDKTIMIKQAETNFNNAKKYQKNILNARREDFFKDIIHIENKICAKDKIK